MPETYGAPITTGSDIDYIGAQFRAVGKDGQRIEMGRQQHEDHWESQVDPYTGEGYRLQFKASVSWLERAYRIFVAENILPAEHEEARQKAKLARQALA
jgi:hypothetical protein